MSIMLVVIHKTLGGHKWSNTHAVQVGTDGTGIPSDADLTTIGMDAALTTTNTNSTSAANFIQRLVAFERRMHLPDVTLNDVYVTDGKRAKANAAATVYATLPIGLTGTSQASSGGVAGALLEVGGVTLMVKRQGVGHSLRPGRMFLRGVLQENMVKTSGVRMIDWEATGLADNQAFLTAALGLGLNTHFSGGVNVAGGVYSIPRYMSKKSASILQPEGTLIACFPVSGLVIGGPVLRQVNRGRRRQAATSSGGGSFGG